MHKFSQEAIDSWEPVLQKLSHLLLTALSSDPEQLNPDRERTYGVLSALLMHLNTVWKNLLDPDLEDQDPAVPALAIIKADQEVRACACVCGCASGLVCEFTCVS